MFLLFFHLYGSFNCANSTSLSFSDFPELFYPFTTFTTYRKSFCSFICQVSLLTSSCQFFKNSLCSLLPCVSLMFIGIFSSCFLMVPLGSCLFLWSRGFSSCYHLKMGKHIAQSSSLTSSLFLHLQFLQWLSFHSFLVLYIPT